jgi:hypothetical protein
MELRKQNETNFSPQNNNYNDDGKINDIRKFKTEMLGILTFIKAHPFAKWHRLTI